MIELNAPITDVTVYSDRALITRRGTIELEVGEHELRINNLPQFLRDSLRAAGQGPQGTRILNVDVTTAFYSQPPEAELRTLQSELEALVQNKQLLEARQSALNDRRQWLRALGEQSRDFAKGLAQGQMKPQDCADFFSFTAAQALQDAEAAQGLEVQLKQVNLEIGAKKREIAQQQGGTFPDRLAANVTVEIAQAGELALDLSYLVMGASWHPQYDVRVQMSDEQNVSEVSHNGQTGQPNETGEVDLTYVAIVQQSTGERWQDVALSLSTARPSLAAVLPELEPWYLNVYNPTPLVRGPMFARTSMSAPQGLSYGAPMSSEQTVKVPAIGTAAATSMADTLPEMEQPALPPPLPASIATTTVEQTGTALIFRAGRSVDIPSDNSPHKTTIARDNLPCSFDYVCAPVLEENVHLRATIVNTTDRVLLSGDASIFLGGEYVGTTKVKMIAPTERFKIFLGIDDGIKVKRELTDRSVDKGSMLQAAIRRTTYAYRITVHNYARVRRNIVVRDHLPVSQHERIKVKVQNVLPLPHERTKLEILVWKFALLADAEQIIDYRFVVEHPQDVVITGLA
ncbi:MAG TPA: mucoidy inhibitor MuiA family protein [Ktedonobacteraceae bacterium]|nr:mucoidy inhibitor MuiA family protein [Ktedonobacteraceae bacterium]